MAARVGRNPAGGSKSLPYGAVHEGRGTRQLPDVTGTVQSTAVHYRAKSARCELPCWNCAKFKKRIGEQKQASLSGEQDSQGRGERPPVWGTGYN